MMEKQQQQKGCQCLVMYVHPSVILHNKLCSGALLGSGEQAMLCAQHIQLDNLPKAEYTFLERLFVLMMLHTTLCSLS